MALPRRFFKHLFVDLTNLSMIPFSHGDFGVLNFQFMLRSTKKSWTSSDLNDAALSLIINLGAPLRAMNRLRHLIRDAALRSIVNSK